MPTRFVADQDGSIAAWLFSTAQWTPMLHNVMLGLVDEDGTLKGAAMFTGYNGTDVELHFYGPGLITKRIFRQLAQLSFGFFNVARLTIKTRNPDMIRACTKFGGVFEAKLKRIYGPTDDEENTAHQFVFFRSNRWLKAAGLPQEGK